MCYKYFSFSAKHKHLTTFVLDRKDAMITVDDGIRKLKLLDAKGKVWTQDMILQVDDRAVSLIDLESKASFVKCVLFYFQESSTDVYVYSQVRLDGNG